MIVDTSALIAMLREEPEAEAFRERLLGAANVRVSAGTLVEARIVAARTDNDGELRRLLDTAAAEIVPFDARQAELAFDGFIRFGRGRHPAGLNLGDLFAYALARTAGEPLLFKGGDFGQTDVESAIE
jgi:ribonuclease VapC